MAFFSSTKPDPTRIQRDLEARLKSKLDQCTDNATRQPSEEIELAKAKSGVEQAALGADDTKLDSALAIKRQHEDKLNALQAARSPPSKPRSRCQLRRSLTSKLEARRRCQLRC